MRNGWRWSLKYDGVSLAEQVRNFLSLNILQSNRQKKPKKALQHRWLVFPSGPVATTSQGPRHGSPGSHQQEAGTTASVNLPSVFTHMPVGPAEVPSVH